MQDVRKPQGDPDPEQLGTVRYLFTYSTCELWCIDTGTAIYMYVDNWYPGTWSGGVHSWVLVFHLILRPSLSL